MTPQSKTETKTDTAEVRELSLDEIDATSGAGFWSTIKRIAGAIKDIFDGPGDLRRPLDRP